MCLVSAFNQEMQKIDEPSTGRLCGDRDFKFLPVM